MKYWPLILGTALLAGCARYHARPLTPETSAARLEARRLDDAGLKKFFATHAGAVPAGWPPAAWDLNALTLAAFYFHPDLAVARAQWQLAGAGVKTAGGRPNPTVTVTPEYNTTTAIPTPWGPSVSFDLPIETAGKRGKRIAEAEKLAESARWNYVSAAWQIRGGVRSALADYAMAHQRLPLLQKQLAAQRDIVARLQGSSDAGATPRTELAVAQMALGKLQLDAAAAEAKLLEVRSRLAEAVGVSSAALEGIEIPTDFSATAPEDLTSETARRAALVGRADIRAALADYAAAENNLRLEIAKQYPDLHLNPGYQFDQGDNKWSLGLSLELPILNQNQGPIAESRARRELAAAKFLQLQAHIIAEVDRAIAGWQSAQAQAKTAGDLLQIAEQRQQSIAAQAQAGAATTLDAEAAEIELAAIRLARLDTEAQRQSALGALEDALQRPADTFAALIQAICSGPTKEKKHETHP